MSHWIPFIGWQILSNQDALDLGLDPYHRWEGFCIEWLGRGAIIGVRKARSS